MSQIPPPPIRDKVDSFVWQEWFRQIRDRANDSLISVSWSGIDFNGSSISDIVSRDHNNLTAIQGGTTGEYYHITSAQKTELDRDDNVTTVSVNTTLSDANQTIIVDTTAKVITLPAASTARIGKVWTVILGTMGYTTIQRNGSDSINLPITSTSIRLRNKGASVSFKCLTATSWGIV